MIGRHILRHLFRLILPSLLMLTFPSADLWADESLVTGHYLSATGQDIQLRVQVGNPAPGTMIVIQNLPPGTVIESASPAFNQHTPKSGTVKWLLTGVSPGSYSFGLRLAKPLPPGSISGEIRYKDPGSGRLEKMPLLP